MPLLCVNVPVEFIASTTVPVPLTVIFPVVFPALVNAHVDDSTIADVLADPSVYVIPDANVKFPPTFKLTDALCVSVLAYPVKSTDAKTDVDTFKVQFDAPVPTPSNITMSPVVGTLALSCVLEAVPQFVLPVAFQLAEEPPPTQYRVAAHASWAKNKRLRIRSAFFT